MVMQPPPALAAARSGPSRRFAPGWAVLCLLALLFVLLPFAAQAALTQHCSSEINGDIPPIGNTLMVQFLFI